MAFTEHGILMISSVLKNDKAVQVNIQIMRAFMKMRQMIFDNAELRKQIDELRADTDGKFRIVFETLDQLLFIENKPKKKIGFMAKEKQTEYGERDNRKNERNAWKHIRPHVFTQKPTGETDSFWGLGEYQYAQTITVVFLLAIAFFSNASACNRKSGAMSLQS